MIKSSSQLNMRLYSILKQHAVLEGGRLKTPRGKTHNSLVEVDGEKVTLLQLALACVEGDINPNSKPVTSINDPRVLDISFVKNGENTYLKTGYICGDPVDILELKLGVEDD